MGTFTLEQACTAVAASPSAERAGAALTLARAAVCQLSDGPAWSVLDPLECTPGRAAHCLSAGEVVTVGNEVCLSVLDASLPCPFGARG